MTRFIACFAVATLVGGCGTVSIAAKDGRVTQVATSGLKDVGACVATVIKSIRFKPPLIGCEVISDYPFVFKLQ